MSVLVKGMEMPKGCISCPLQRAGVCYVVNEWIMKSTDGTIVKRGENERAEWCPLVYVEEGESE